MGNHPFTLFENPFAKAFIYSLNPGPLPMLELVIRFVPWELQHHFRRPFFDGHLRNLLLRIELIFRVIRWPLPWPEVHIGFDVVPEARVNLEDHVVEPPAVEPV